MNIPVEGSFLGLASAAWIGVILDLAVKGAAILGTCCLLAWCLRRQSAALLSLMWTLGRAGLQQLYYRVDNIYQCIVYV